MNKLQKSKRNFRNSKAWKEFRHPVNPWKEDLSTYNYGSTRYGVKVSGKF